MLSAAILFNINQRGSYTGPWSFITKPLLVSNSYEPIRHFEITY